MQGMEDEGEEEKNPDYYSYYQLLLLQQHTKTQEPV